MTGKLATFLGDDDVKFLTRLIDSLESSKVDFFELKVGDLHVRLGKGEPPAAESQVGADAIAPTPPVAPAPAAVPDVAPLRTETASAGTESSAPELIAEVGADAHVVAESEAGVDIVSSLMGVFYAQAEPGAPAFVTLGSHVSRETTVGLVEVMKTFAPVAAGVEGTVVEICVNDSEIVEYGQRLFVVRPDEAA